MIGAIDFRRRQGLMPDGIQGSTRGLNVTRQMVMEGNQVLLWLAGVMFHRLLLEAVEKNGRTHGLGLVRQNANEIRLHEVYHGGGVGIDRDRRAVSRQCRQARIRLIHGHVQDLHHHIRRTLSLHTVAARIHQGHHLFLDHAVCRAENRCHRLLWGKACWRNEKSIAKFIVLELLMQQKCWQSGLVRCHHEHHLKKNRRLQHPRISQSQQPHDQSWHQLCRR